MSISLFASYASGNCGMLLVDQVKRRCKRLSGELQHPVSAAAMQYDHRQQHITSFYQAMKDFDHGLPSFILSGTTIIER